MDKALETTICDISDAYIQYSTLKRKAGADPQNLILRWQVGVAQMRLECLMAQYWAGVKL